ncbi:hypothetical protein ACLHDG_05020 [Sulfurovum sp. CS9]|uniref:hypothetical protein n=1 Tax=Sulfurovum sp. CS9 TaxID=3391146 RepID=UPI0039EAE892
MLYKKILFFLFLITLALSNPLKASIKITKQMLKGKVLQTQKFGTNLTVKFIPSITKSFDGDIVFHFSTNEDDDNEVLSYKLIDGKIIYYAYDGSKHRMTLLSIESGTWVMLEEEDIDGDDKQFGFEQAVKKVYSVKKSGEVQTVKESMSASYANVPSHTSSNDMIDLLTMQIYGRLDTRIASRKEYLKNINEFLHTASMLLIKKHKIDIQLQEIRQHQMAAVGAPPEVTGLMNELGSIENLDGQTIVDHDDNIHTTMAELQQAFSKAGKKAMQFQRDNYISEKERKSELVKLEVLLTRSGSTEQKNDMKEAEIKQAKDEYRYYKKLLDTSSVWCLADKNASQKKPLFYPKTFVIELLYQKYKIELFRSGKSYDAKELFRRAKKIEVKSQKIKHLFNRDYLYVLRTKPDRIRGMQ